MSTESPTMDRLMVSMYHEECDRLMDVIEQERQGACVLIEYRCPACETAIQRQEIR